MADDAVIKFTILSSGRRVIDIERDALDALSSALDQSFVDAVNACIAASGRVILTGVGKSGHVARKIAATLASTGTPSLYIHPTEASHGDLGMVTKQDVVIALSRSGETKELSDLIEYTSRFGITLIALTAVQNSALGRAANICLTIPEFKEACGETKAPTTSTTLSMAMGDALAVAVLEQRGFTGEDFKVFHPGGKLGAMLRTVGDLMGDKVPVVTVGTALSEGLKVLSEGTKGCLAVTKGTSLVGMITDGDVRRVLAQGKVPETVDEVMSIQPITVTPDTLASKALAVMNERRITQLVVVEADTTEPRPIGILHMHDLLKAGVV